MKLKLFIDKNTNKVLYAEAGKDFVDFLLHTFTKPLGLAMKEDFNGEVTCGLANLFTSVVDDLSVDYLESGSTTKDAFLNPNLLQKLYFCMYCKNGGEIRVCDVYGAVCPVCNQQFCREAAYVPLESSVQIGKGYVNGLMTYIITDDLIIKPVSTTLDMTLLSQLRIKDFSCVQVSEVTLDSDKGKKLIKASLTSKTVLTDTFLPLMTEK